jgi:hypothetical protein
MEREIMNRDFCPRNNCIFYNRIGVHEAPGLLKEGGRVMKKIQSEAYLKNSLPSPTNSIPPSLRMGPQRLFHAAADRGARFSDEQERG